jgi:hypothetical protein
MLLLSVTLPTPLPWPLHLQQRLIRNKNVAAIGLKDGCKCKSYSRGLGGVIDDNDVLRDESLREPRRGLREGEEVHACLAVM